MYKSGAARGGWTFGTPPMEKLSEKNDVVPEGSILSKNFQFFYLIFIKKIQNVLKNSPTICIFRPHARKLNAGVLTFFEK